MPFGIAHGFGHVAEILDGDVGDFHRVIPFSMVLVFSNRIFFVRCMVDDEVIIAEREE